MSSTHSTFVKAYARQSRAAAPSETPPAATASPPEAPHVVAPQRPAPPAAPGVPEGSLMVDRSVASSTAVWIDPIEAEVMRSDSAAKARVPRPHLADRAETVPSPKEQSHESEHQTLLGAMESGLSGLVTSHLEIVHTEYALAAFEPLSISGTSQEDTIVRADRGHAVPAPAMERSEAYARSNPGESLQDESSTATTPPERDLEIAPEYDPEPEFSPGGSEPLAAPSVAVDSPRIDPPVASAAVAPVAPTRAQSTEPESSDPAASEVDVWIDPAAEVIEQQDREAAERQIPPFQCAWEVDQFDLPARVSELFLDGELFGQLTERLADAVSSGLRSMLMTASHRGEGCSTVAMGIAVAAAAAGIKTALVDADLKDPTLADDLRLDMEFGWVESLRGSLSIDEVAIQSVTDALTLIPLIPNRQAPAATAGEATNVIAQLAPHFDLIVIDAGHQSESVMAELAKHIETAIVVRDPNRTTPAQVNQLAYKLREAGAKGIGVVENFS